MNSKNAVPMRVRLMPGHRFIIGVILLGSSARVAAETPQPPALPKGAIARLGVPRLQLTAPLVFAPDGKSFFGITPDDEILRHDAKTGVVVERVRIDETMPRKELSPESGRALFGSQKAFSVWDIDKKRRLIHVAPNVQSLFASLSPDGKKVIGRVTFGPGAHRVLVWDVDTKVERTISNTSGTTAMSPDGNKLLISNGFNVDCHDVHTTKIIWTAKNLRLEKSAFSPDGKSLLTGGVVIDMNTGIVRSDWKLPNGHSTSQPAIAPDGRTLLYPSSEGVELWDLIDGRSRCRLPGTARPVSWAASFLGGFSPDGKSFLTNFGATQRWDLATGKPMLPDTADLGSSAPTSTLAFSPDGKLLASGAFEDFALRIWDLSESRLRCTLRGHHAYTRAVLFTPDGKSLISGGGDSTIRIWNADDGREIKVLKLHDGKTRADHQQIGSMRLLPGGRRLAIATMLNFGPEERTAWSVWNLPDAKRLDHKVNPFDADESVGYRRSPINRPLLGADGSVLLSDQGWFLNLNGKVIRPRVETTGNDHVYQPVLSHDGWLIAGQVHPGIGTGQAHVAIWESLTGQALIRVPIEANYLAFSPVSPHLIAIDSDGIKVWNWLTGRCDQTFNVSAKKPNWCSALAVSSDGKLMATGMTDSTVMVWKLDVPGYAIAAPLADAWANLADPAPAKGVAAAHRLRLGGAKTTELLAKELAPVSLVPVERVTALVSDLNKAQFNVRQKAERELRQLGEGAVPHLRAALVMKPDADTAKRIEAILADYSDDAVPRGKPLRDLRAIAVLEQINSADARQLLKRLAAGAEHARSTREARSKISSDIPD